LENMKTEKTGFAPIKNRSEALVFYYVTTFLSS